MAGPLRRVSQNYHWTLKRARNDLHNSITPDLQPAPASPNIDAIVSPWDSARLQCKFKNEYDELCEHLKFSFLILLGWWVTFKHLTKAAAEHFIAQTNEAVSNLSNESTKLTIYVTCSISVWGLLTALFRDAVSRVVFPTQPFLSRSTSCFGVNKGEETGTHPALLPSPRKPLLDVRPAQSPYVESTTHAPPGPQRIITIMSDLAHSAYDASLVDSLKDGVEKLHSARLMGERWPFKFYVSPSLDGDNRKPP